MVNVSLSQVSLNYPGTDRPAVSEVDLTINDGEFLVLVGPSGCGKSTTLRMIAGLEFPTSGSILFNDDDVTDLSPKDRDVAMVFQSYALYPHMTVANNMAFALKNAGVPKDKREAQVLEAAKLLELDGLLNRKPRELSGGQRQRVAMGRAIVRAPKVFLMDEPLSNLDAKLRVQTRAQITALQRRLDVTTIYVTHDQTEAMTMGDRVVVMNAGRIEQIGTPRELYDRPKSLFVAAFIGSPTMNLLTVKRGPDNTATGNGITVNLPDIPDGIDDLVVGIRPEDLSTQPGPGTSSFDITLTLVEELGSDSFAYGTTSGQDPLSISEKPIVARLPKGEIPTRGQNLTLYVDPDRLRVFDAKTEQLIG